MAFLERFEHDVFISYSHVDNLGDDAWVERFHEQLEIALARRIGRMGVAKLWRDQRLEGNQLFDETIRNAIERAAVFIGLTSNGYLESDYCRQELKWFHDKAASEPFGLQIGDRSRVYNVLLTPVPPARWPGEYPKVSGYPFYAGDQDEDLGEPTDPSLDKQRYKDQLTALANSLYKTLLAFKESLEHAEPAASTTAPAPQDGPTVFIGDVADSMTSARRRIIVELQRKGVVVEAAVPPPYSAAEHAKRIEALSGKAVLSVHLLDQFAGREIDGDPGASYPQKQVELMRGQGRPQLIWVPKALDVETVEDEGYRAFLGQLETGDRAGAQYDFIRGVAPTLAPQILERLAELQPKPESSAAASPAILLDTHLKDQLYALEIGKLLLEHNIQPYINPQEDDPNKNLETFEARLGQVSSLMIVFGSVSESWVRHRLGVALQLSVVKNLALKSFCVVLVPPEKQKPQADFSLGPVPVRLIDNSGSTVVNRSLLEPLFRSAFGGGAV